MPENLQKIQIENPVDLVISQIKDLISSGILKPSEKLPLERKFEINRGQAREAISKLQLYGIVKVQSQSDTTVNGIGIVALRGLIKILLSFNTNYNQTFFNRYKIT